MLPTTKTKRRADLSGRPILLYGPPKVGKSEFCSKMQDSVFLDSENGLKDLEVFRVPVTNWIEFGVACRDLLEQQSAEEPFKVVVVDTIDNVYRFCEEYVCEQQGIIHQSDLEYGKGWALVTGEFRRVLTKLCNMQYGVVFVAHSVEKEEKTRTGPVTRAQLSMPRGARDVLLQMVDFILFADYQQGVGKNGEVIDTRVIRTRGGPFYEAGCRTRAQIPETIPLDYNAFLKAYVDANLKAQNGERKSA